MKVIVERDALADAVGSVRHATDKGLKIPILANALLRANGASLEIAATNLDVRSEHSVAAEIERGEGDPDAITVPVTLLSDLASRMPKGSQIKLEWEPKAQHVTLSAGRARYKLNALPATDFPILPPPDKPIQFSMPGKQFATALNAVRWTTYDSVDRPNVMGVFVHVTDDNHPALGSSKQKRLAFVATDHAQLARITVDVPTGLTALPHLILPNGSLTEIARLANEADDEIQIAVSESKFSISDGHAVFLTKLIDAKFQEGYVRIIPEKEDAQMRADIDALSDALLRLKALGDDNRTRIEITQSLLTLSLINATRGQAEERIEVEYDADPLSLPVNASAWLSILEHMQADVCLFRFKRSEGNKNFPIVMNPMKGFVPDYTQTFLTMPMER